MCSLIGYSHVVGIIKNSKFNAHILKDFNPREPCVLSLQILQVEERRTRIEPLLRRAACSAAKTNNMIVSIAFQVIIPSKCHYAYTEEGIITENEAQAFRVQGNSMP